MSCLLVILGCLIVDLRVFFCVWSVIVVPVFSLLVVGIFEIVDFVIWAVSGPFSLCSIRDR